MEIIIPEGVAAIFLITADAAGEIQEMMADAGIGIETGIETGTGIGMIPAGEVLHRSLHPEVLADVKKKNHKRLMFIKQEDERPSCFGMAASTAA